MDDGKIGGGAVLQIPDDVPTEKVWKALILKITRPDLFVPAVDLVIRSNADGSTYREMTVGGKRMIENVYIDEAKMEIRAEIVDGEDEYVNCIVIEEETGDRLIELYKRRRLNLPPLPGRGLARIQTMSIGINAVNKIVEIARTL